MALDLFVAGGSLGKRTPPRRARILSRLSMTKPVRYSLSSFRHGPGPAKTIRRAVWLRPHSGDMRVTFPRLPDHERAWALVERDDGVVYRLYGGTPGRGCRTTSCTWWWSGNCASRTASGAHRGGRGLRSMQHVSGRRPPHAAEHSKALLRRLPRAGPARRTPRRPRVQRRGTGHDDPGQDQAAAGAKLSVLPSAAVDPVVIAVAARALQVEAARWARLRVGEELSYDWPRK